jgi:nucleotide-binding universal stress UspA family protein
LLKENMRVDNILVPIDFSPPSRSALHYAMALAQQCRARLMLLHVAESSAAFSYSFPEDIAEIERRHVEDARRLLGALVTPEDRNGLDLITTVKSGEVVDEIASTAVEEGADLLVMGAHGHGLLRRSVIGSVARKILERLDVPVVMVRRLARVPAFRRILFVTDFSESSRSGLHSALDLARITRSNLIALNAVDVGLEGGAEAAVYLSESRLEEAHAKLQQLKADTRQKNFDVDAVVAEGSIAGTVIKAAQEKSADLIAIGVPRHGDVSIAEGLISDSHMPVLAIPVSESASAESPSEAPAA